MRITPPDCAKSASNGYPGDAKFHHLSIGISFASFRRRIRELWPFFCGPSRKLLKYAHALDPEIRISRPRRYTKLGIQERGISRAILRYKRCLIPMPYKEAMAIFLSAPGNFVVIIAPYIDFPRLDCSLHAIEYPGILYSLSFRFIFRFGHLAILPNPVRRNDDDEVARSR